jgi:hypothetical protein
MTLERSNVDFPLWRKKVDKSLFDHSATPIPAWACDIWSIQDSFSHVPSKKHNDSEVILEFQGKKYKGNITITSRGRKTPGYRLWFNDDLTAELKQVFLMSHMRALEQSLSGKSSSEIEDDIPFWEFLDIEYDNGNRVFKLNSHYTQKPSFPNLFHRLIQSPVIQKIESEIKQKNEKPGIIKTNWKPRSKLKFELGAKNVIYMLADTKNKLLYIGEAKDLVKRLHQIYPKIKHWDYFRYDVLPDELFEFRLTLERMLIRSFAAVLGNKKNVDSLDFSEYELVNDKIDI